MRKRSMEKTNLIIFTLIFVLLCNILPVNMLTLKAAAEESSIGTVGISTISGSDAMAVINDENTNLISDGDFESDVNLTITQAGNSTAGVWTYYVKPGDDVNLTITNADEGRNGRALQVSGATDTYVKINQNVSVEEGKTYTGSVWVKAVDVKNYGESQAKAQLNIASGTIVTNLQAGDCAGSWAEISFTYTATETGNINVGIALYATGSGTWLVDDFTMKEVAVDEKEDTNLISDGDFESDVNITITQAGMPKAGAWAYYVKPGNEVNLTVTNADEGRSGKALQVSGVTDTYVKINQNVSVEEGKTYMGSVWVKAVDVTNYPGGQAKAQLNIASGAVLTNLQAGDCAGSWVEIPFTHTAAATGDITVAISLYATGSGTWLVDDFTMKEAAVDEEETDNYVFNGDFEYDTDAAVLELATETGRVDLADSGWRARTASSSQAPMDFQIVQSGHNDSYALKISRTITGTSTVWGIVSQEVTGLTVGEKYQVTAWFRIVNESNQNANGSIQVYENGQEKILLSLTNAAATGEWQELSCEYIPKASNVDFQIHGGYPQTGYFLVDDISFKKMPEEPSLKITPDCLELEVGDETTVAAEVIDPNELLEDVGTIQFTSEDTSIVTVDESGKVTAVAAGKTGIIVTAAEGKVSAVCEVTVTEKEIALTGISMKEAALELCVGSQKKLEVEFTPADAGSRELSWSSSNEQVASVNENGVVTAWKNGTAVITATEAGGLTAECTLTVRESSGLTTNKAVFAAEYGTRFTDSLNNTKYVTNNTGNASLVFGLLTSAANGVLQLADDGTFVYIPDNYDVLDKYTDSFMVSVTAGTESAVLEVEIIVGEMEETIASALNSDTTMLITREQLAKIKADVQNSDSVKYKIWNQYKSYLEYLLTTDAPEDQNPACPTEDCSQDSRFESQWQREVGDSVAHLLMGWLITGEDSYKEKCIEYTMASVNYKHWGSIDMYGEADLAAGHQAYAVGLVYNWMHEELTDDQKAQIVKKLYTTCGKFETRNADSLNYQQNHLWVSMTGLCSASISLYIHAEEAAEALNDGTTAEVVRKNCVRWLNLVYEKTGNSFKWAAKDGASHEGAGYFTYGLEYLMKTALLLNNNLGIDLITDNEWMENNSSYFLNTIYPKNSISTSGSLIDYADGTRTNWYGPSHLFRVLAALYQDETAQWIAQTFEDAEADKTGSSTWLGLLFASDEVEAKLDSDSSRLYYAEDLGIVTARTNWSGDESIVFLRSGLPLGKTGLELLTSGSNEYHVDPDCNALILYSNGEYLLRTDGYAKQKMTKNHSTLLVDGNGQIGGNDYASGMVGDLFYTLGLEPEIKVTETGDGYSYFVGDSTEAYDPDYGLRKFERNVVLLEEENVLLVVDDVRASENKDLELRWFPESKNVMESYGIYTVSGSKNVMKFYAFTEETDTVFADADVYITTAANQTEKAFIQTFNGAVWQNAVAFSWSEAGGNQAYVKYMEGDTNEHKFEVNGKIYTINVAENTVKVENGSLGLAAQEHESDSSLDKITLNSLDLENFDSEVTEYEVERFWKVDSLQIVATPSSPSATVEMQWDGKWPGTATIVCTSGDKSSTTEYKIHITDESGLLSIQSATASPNMFGFSVDLTYDSYIQEDGTDKTWSSTNLPAVTWDMGKLVDITRIDVAFNTSRDRNTYYNLLISEDGENWVTVDEVDDTDGGAPKTTTGKRSDYVTIYEGDALRARYVQIQLRAHSNTTLDDASVYNSIQEVSFYGTVVSTDEDDEDENTGESTTPDEGGSTDESTTPDEGGSTDESTTPDEGGSTDESTTPDEGGSTDESTTLVENGSTDETITPDEDNGTDETTSDEGCSTDESTTLVENGSTGESTVPGEAGNVNQDSSTAPATGDDADIVGSGMTIVVLLAVMSILFWVKKKEMKTEE